MSLADEKIAAGQEPAGNQPSGDGMTTEEFADIVKSTSENDEERRSGKGFLHFFLHGVVSTYFIAMLMMFLGAMFGAILVQIPFRIVGMLNDDHPVVLTSATYLAFIGIWGTVIGYLIIFRNDSPYLHKILGQANKTSVKGWILGCFIVGGMNLLCILLAMANSDISLYFYSFDIIPLVFLFVAVFVQSGAEEILCRGFIYRRLEKTYNPVVATIFNSLFFVLLHIGNPGVTILSLINVFLCGVMFSLIIYYTDSMAFAMAGHAGWNFCQSVLFGLPNSGQSFPYSLMKLDAASARNSFFYHVDFGIEGSAFSVIILAVASAVIIVLGQLKILKKPGSITPLF
ncbi:MAG: CPBP family intramembrane metalloprotease [Lachnospiraceae bacterium]|nr:CPBP family intramembrane metalloprotease [Lachnospiraceae bacterium]